MVSLNEVKMVREIFERVIFELLTVAIRYMHFSYICETFAILKRCLLKWFDPN